MVVTAVRRLLEVLLPSRKQHVQCSDSAVTPLGKVSLSDSIRNLTFKIVLYLQFIALQN
jgi:hypothetical protein